MLTSDCSVESLEGQGPSFLRGPVLPISCVVLRSGLSSRETFLELWRPAIAAEHVHLKRHSHVSRFMCGTRQLRPFCPEALTGPFEPSALNDLLTLKKFLLLDPHFSQENLLSLTCLHFSPGLVKVLLRPRLGYLPKVVSSLFHSQTVVLQSLAGEREVA